MIGEQTDKGFNMKDMELLDAPAVVIKPGESVVQAGPQGLGVITNNNKPNEIQLGVYTSYAKDIFVAILSKRGENDVTLYSDTMVDSINLVKQAKEAFE